MLLNGKREFLLIFKGKTMMDRKPWQDKGLRRSFDGDEGGERRRFGRFDRFDREERSDRREFGTARPCLRYAPLCRTL